MRTMRPFWVVALGTAAVLPAQQRLMPNPVATRVEVSHYGEFVGNSAELMIGCDVTANQDRVLLQGGTPGNAALVLFGTAPDNVPLASGTLLVGPAIVPIAGVFNTAGEFAVPIDLANRALAYHDFYLQGMQPESPRMLPPPGPEMTWGLHLRVVAGNAQPPLGYQGRADFVLCKEVSKFVEATIWNMVARLDVPYANYVLQLVSVDTVNGVTNVTLALNVPASAIGGPQTLRMPVTLPTFPGKVIQVWVAVLPPQGGGCAVLAAAIERDF